MAATAWSVYNTFKEYIANGTINVSGGNFDMHFFTSAASANVNNAVLSTLGSLGNEVASANNYTLSGRAMTVTWATGASASEFRWTMADIVLTASGGSISNIKYAVIVARTGASAKDGTNAICMFSRLSTSQFTLTDADSITIQDSANGIFELN